MQLYFVISSDNDIVLIVIMIGGDGEAIATAAGPVDSVTRGARLRAGITNTPQLTPFVSVHTYSIYALLLPVEHRLQTTRLQPALSCVHFPLAEPEVHICLSRSLFQMFLGRPHPLWPCGIARYLHRKAIAKHKYKSCT